jgi:hypothetical protein
MARDDQPVGKEQLADLLQSMQAAGAEQLPPGADEAAVEPMRAFITFLTEAAAAEAPPTWGELQAAIQRLAQALPHEGRQR